MIKRLLIYDLKYYWYVILIMAMPLSIFTIFGIVGFTIDMKIEFFNKYFWPITIGLGTYLLIYGMHVNKHKEKHERIHALIPVTIKQRTIYRFIFGVSPIIVIALYLEFLRAVFPIEIHETIRRIDAQLSLLFIFLAIMSSSVDFLQNPNKKQDRTIKSGVLLITLAIISAGFIILVGSEIIPPIIKGRDEIYFYLWGIVLSIVASGVYYKRSLFA